MPAWPTCGCGTTRLPHLRDAYRVITHDTRGYGETVTDAVEFSNRADIAALLDHLDEERAHVVGLSRGGQIALDFTLEFPERVHSLTVAAGGVGGYESPDEGPARHLGRARGDADREELGGPRRLGDRLLGRWPGAVTRPRSRRSARSVHDWILTTYRAEKEEGDAAAARPARRAVGWVSSRPRCSSCYGTLDEPAHVRIDASPGRIGARRAARGLRVGAHDQPRACRSDSTGAPRLPGRAPRGLGRHRALRRVLGGLHGLPRDAILRR